MTYLGHKTNRGGGESNALCNTSLWNFYMNSKLCPRSSQQASVLWVHTLFVHADVSPQSCGQWKVGWTKTQSLIVLPVVGSWACVAAQRSEARGSPPPHLHPCTWGRRAQWSKWPLYSCDSPKLRGQDTALALVQAGVVTPSSLLYHFHLHLSQQCLVGTVPVWASTVTPWFWVHLHMTCGRPGEAEAGRAVLVVSGSWHTLWGWEELQDGLFSVSLGKLGLHKKELDLFWERSGRILGVAASLSLFIASDRSICISFLALCSILIQKAVGLHLQGHRQCSAGLPQHWHAFWFLGACIAVY